MNLVQCPLEFSHIVDQQDHTLRFNQTLAELLLQSSLHRLHGGTVHK